MQSQLPKIAGIPKGLKFEGVKESAEVTALLGPRDQSTVKMEIDDPDKPWTIEGMYTDHGPGYGRAQGDDQSEKPDENTGLATDVESTHDSVTQRTGFSDVEGELSAASSSAIGRQHGSIPLRSRNGQDDRWSSPFGWYDDNA
jgi:hypothetical protein